MKSNPELISFFFYFLVAFDSATAQCSMTSVTVDCLYQLGQGEAFAETVQLNSSKNVTISVGIGEVTYGWLNLKRRMYNSRITGPTLTVKPGDTLNVSLINTLSDDGNEVPHPNTTNLHTHGLHISPKEPQDNVLIRVQPGETYNYVYQIHPKNAPGTNWYHAHVHGTTAFQVTSGLSGMLIVEDNVADMPPELAAVSCPDNCHKDIQMLFQGILQYTGFGNFGSLQNSMNDYEAFKNDQYILEQGGTLAEFLVGNLYKYTINGQLEPVLTMETGQMYRFRMANAAAVDSFELYIVNGTGEPTNSCTIREIALDGVYLDAPRPQHDGQSLLVPGGRVDWMIKCDVVGKYYLKSFPYLIHRPSTGNNNQFKGNLMKLDVSGNKVSPVQNFPTTLPARPTYMNDLRSVDKADIDGRFVIELTPFNHLNRELWKSSAPNYRYKMAVGSIQEWNFINADGNFSHPMHIHVNHFQVISYNEYTGAYGIHEENWPLRDVKDRSICLYQREGYVESDRKKRSEPETVNQAGTEATAPVIDFNGDPLQYLGHEVRYAADEGNTLGYARLGEWRETLLIPSLANITIRFIAHEYVGDVMIHCHILMDEDAGMRMVVEIVPEGESTEANITSGNAYPGTCRACDRYPFNNPETLGACYETMESTSASSSENTSLTTFAPTSDVTDIISNTTTAGNQRMFYLSGIKSQLTLAFFSTFILSR